MVASRRRRRFVTSLAGVVFCAAAIHACSSPLSPLPAFQLPPEDTSLSLSALRPPDTAFLCGTWIGAVPHPDSAILLDLAFGNLSPSDPLDRPASADREIITRHGGRILYTFAFPAFRVWIRAGEVPGLVAESRRLVSVLRVAAPRRFDWPFVVIYRASQPYTESDEARLASLGARIHYRFDAFNMLGGVIPNRRVPALRGDANVELVEGVPPWPLCNP